MSEEPVDANSKASLTKRLGVLLWGDVKKSLTSFTTYAAPALLIWQLIGPIYHARGVSDANTQIADVTRERDSALSDVANFRAAADSNKAAYNEASQQNAKLALDLDTCRADPPAKSVEKATKQEASLTPTVKKVKTKAIQAPKQEPSTCQQIEACKAVVTWFEQNVGTPGVN